jgi:hypothetical protein
MIFMKSDQNRYDLMVQFSFNQADQADRLELFVMVPHGGIRYSSASAQSAACLRRASALYVYAGPGGPAEHADLISRPPSDNSAG